MRRVVGCVMSMMWCDGAAGRAWAGMPSVGFSEVGAMRLQSISFFLVGLLVSAAVVYGLWNWLCRDFSRLPRLTYPKACGVVVLWGLLFVVVLTMISGARELMTPGAWERKDDRLTYRLGREGDQENRSAAADNEFDDVDFTLARRREHLAQLRSELWRYADLHDGRFPDADRAGAVDRRRWALPGMPGLRYVYVPRSRGLSKPLPLVYEPEVFGEECLVLMTDGSIEALPLDHILAMAPSEVDRS